MDTDSIKEVKEIETTKIESPGRLGQWRLNGTACSASCLASFRG